jgi:hypothetical protein
MPNETRAVIALMYLSSSERRCNIWAISDDFSRLIWKGKKLIIYPEAPVPRTVHHSLGYILVYLERLVEVIYWSFGTLPLLGILFMEKIPVSVVVDMKW